MTVPTTDEPQQTEGVTPPADQQPPAEDPPQSPVAAEPPKVEKPSGPAAEIDWKAKARYEEERSKETAAENQKLKEQLAKAEEGSQKAQQLEAQIAERDLKLLTYQAAVKAGVPHLADRLRGTTEEELLADARTLTDGLANPLAGHRVPGQSANASDPEAARKEFADRLSKYM